MNIWFIADTHFWHSKIIEYEKRPFSCAEEMNEVIIENWNKLIKPKDEVWHLGDVALCGTQKLQEIMNRLNGNKKLKLGNHDKANSVTKWEKVGFSEVYRENIIYSSSLLLSHAPIENSEVKNVHGHVHSNIQDLDQSIYKCVSVECTNYKPIHIDEIVK